MFADSLSCAKARHSTTRMFNQSTNRLIAADFLDFCRFTFIRVRTVSVLRSGKLLSDAPEIDEDSAPSSPEKSGKRRLMSLDDLDGRTRAKRVAAQTLADLLSDAGGEDHVSTGQRALLEHASVLHALTTDMAVRSLAGEAIDLQGYVTATNGLRRLLETAGLRRVPRDVTRSPA